MKVPQFRLLLAGIFFFSWLGWLGYLAFLKSAPVIVSRSQLMAAQHFVLAEITVDAATGKPKPLVNVVEDLRPVGDKPLVGPLVIDNLHTARIGGASDFSKPGKYLLPLTPFRDGSFQLTLPPPSPRADGPFDPPPRPWAYWWEAPGVAQQFETFAPNRP